MRKTEIISLLLCALVALYAFWPGSGQSQLELKSDTEQSTLTLEVLPAIETAVLGETEQVQVGRTIYKSFTIGVRANTAWSLDYQITNPTTLNTEGQCWTTARAVGERNRDNGFQTVSISCAQPISWADPPTAIGLTYSISSGLSDLVDD
jgi:hypothetical protein